MSRPSLRHGSTPGTRPSPGGPPAVPELAPGGSGAARMSRCRDWTARAPRRCAERPDQAQSSSRDGGGPPGWGTRPSPRHESEDAHMNTRTIAVVALVIAVLLLFFFVI